jgi:hypothetical protein
MNGDRADNGENHAWMDCCRDLSDYGAFIAPYKNHRPPITRMPAEKSVSTNQRQSTCPRRITNTFVGALAGNNNATKGGVL